jgi:hypothetical protein
LDVVLFFRILVLQGCVFSLYGSIRLLRLRHL